MLAVQTKRNFYHAGPTYIRESGLVGAWNMETKNGTVLDVSGNSNDGIINGALDHKGAIGRALRFMAAQLDTATIQAAFGIIDYPFALECVVISETASTNFAIAFVDFNAATKYFSVGRNATNFLIARRNTTSKSTDTAVPIAMNRRYHVVVNFINETTIELILDGVQAFYSDAEDSVPKPDATFDSIGLGVLRIASPSNYWDGIIENTPRLYSKRVTVAEALIRYNKISNQVLFRDDNSDVDPDGITQSAALGEYRIDSGTFNFDDDSTSKFIECDTNGTISIPYGPDFAVGNGFLKVVTGDLSADQGGTIDASSAFSVSNNRLSIAMTAGQKLRKFVVTRAT